MAILFNQTTAQEYHLESGKLTIGRAPKNTVVLTDTRSSRFHCEIWLKDTTYWLKDLQSRNGTFINGCQVIIKELQDGDRIRVGDSHLLFFTSAQLPEPWASLAKMPRDYFLEIQEPGKPARQFALRQTRVTVGRGSKNMIKLQDDKTSSRHAEIFFEEGHFKIRDLQSRNGTRVNGRRVSQTTIVPGDLIELGRVRLRLRQAGVAEQSPGALSAPTVEDLEGTVAAQEAIPTTASASRSAPQTSAAAPQTSAAAPQTSAAAPQTAGSLPKIPSATGQPAAASRPAWAPMAVVSVVLLLSGLVAGLLWRQLEPPRCLPCLPDNQISDFSFEKRGFWHLQAGMQIKADPQAHSGRCCLVVHNDHPATILEATYWEHIPVSAHICYRLSAWVRPQGCQGLVGFKFQWLRQQQVGPLQSDLGPLYQLKQPGWQKISALVEAPDRAQAVQCSCVVIGRVAQLRFDDVQFVPTMESVHPLSLERLQESLQLTSTAHCQLKRHGQPVLTQGQVRLWHQPLNGSDQSWHLLARQDVATGHWQQQPDHLTWQGQMLLLNGKGWYALRLDFSKQADGFTIELRTAAQPRSSQILLEYSWQCAPALFSQGISLQSNQVYRLIEPARLQKQIGQHMIWQNKAGQRLGFMLGRPVIITLQDPYTTPRLRLLMPVQAQQPTSLRLHLKTDFHEDLSRLQQLRNQAQQACQQQRPGQALQLYQQLVAQFPLQAARVETLIKRLQTQAQQVEQELTHKLQQARFFNTLEDYQQLMQLLQQQYKRWQGAPCAAKFALWLQEIQKEAHLLQQNRQRLAVQLLQQRAEDLARAQQPALALLFYQELLRVYPQHPTIPTVRQKIAALRQQLAK